MTRRPAFDLRHYSPKTRRPNSSPKRFACSGSLAARKRSASSKKLLLFLFPRFDAQLNEFHRDTVVAQAEFWPCDPLVWQWEQEAIRSFEQAWSPIVHQFGALGWRPEGTAAEIAS